MKTEPLYNVAVIDRITKALLEYGIDYSSTIVSNGYLFDDAIARRAVSLWKLKTCQITLDGTKDIYLASKRYANGDPGAYDRVVGNIGLLLDAGIEVHVRLNVSLTNLEDLKTLVVNLDRQLKGHGSERRGKPDEKAPAPEDSENRRKIYFYAHCLFDSCDTGAEHTKENRLQLLKNEEELELLIGSLNKGFRRRLPKRLAVNYCQVDSGISYTILPDGSVGLCENTLFEKTIGTIESGSFDQGMSKEIRRYCAEIPECAHCVLYPQCRRLEVCADSRDCIPEKKERRIRDLLAGMEDTVKRWESSEKETLEKDSPDQAELSEGIGGADSGENNPHEIDEDDFLKH